MDSHPSAVDDGDYYKPSQDKMISLMKSYFARDNIKVTEKEANLKYNCVKHFGNVQYLTNRRPFGQSHNCHDDQFYHVPVANRPNQADHRFHLLFKFVDGNSFDLMVPSENTTIKQVKEMIEAMYGYPKLQQQIKIYNSQRTVCSNHRATLKDYGITSGTKMWLFLGHSLNGFVGDPLILMANLTQKPYSQINLDERVLTYNRDLQSFESCPVIDKLSFKDAKHHFQYKITYTEIDIHGNSGQQTSTLCNKRKAFWVPRKQAWCSLKPSQDYSRVETQILEIGDIVLGSKPIQGKVEFCSYLVSSIEMVPFEDAALLQTITVEKNHNYFMNGVLSHNDSSGVMKYVFMDRAIFDSSWDYNFMDVDDTRSKNYRGVYNGKKWRYYRPIGCYKFGTNPKKYPARYQNTGWLDDFSNDWATAYHATSSSFAVDIMSKKGDGFRFKKPSSGGKYGAGVYVSRFVDYALCNYSDVFSYTDPKTKKSEQWIIILQCKVNVKQIFASDEGKRSCQQVLQKVTKNGSSFSGTWIDTQDEGVIGKSTGEASGYNSSTKQFTFTSDGPRDILDKSCEWVINPEYIMPYCVLFYPKAIKDIMKTKQNSEGSKYVDFGV